MSDADTDTVQVECDYFFVCLGPGNSITDEFSIEVCENGEHEITCQEKNNPEFKKVITLGFSTEGKYQSTIRACYTI